MTIPRGTLLCLVALALVVLAMLVAPIPQPAGYHQFADQRTVFGIPNAWNVLSNLPFAFIGGWGLGLLWHPRPPPTFDAPWERWPWTAFFAGITLTTFGSAWYHLAADNARLLWDRLPMTLAFMGLLTASVADRVSVRVARRLLLPLLLLGVGSVVHWYLGERAGHGDLRAYVILVQGGSFLMILLLTLFYPPRRGGNGALFAALGFYVLAKLLEEADHAIWSAGVGLAGHALKHLSAAAAVAVLTWRLRQFKEEVREGNPA